MSASLTSPFNRCRPRRSVIYSSLCVAMIFIAVSTQVQVERAGNRLHFHFSAGLLTVFRATTEFLVSPSGEKISL
jgi:hypothetical protein